MDEAWFTELGVGDVDGRWGGLDLEAVDNTGHAKRNKLRDDLIAKLG